MDESNSSYPDAYPRLLTPADLRQILQISGRTLTRLVSNGTFPQPIIIGHSRRWRPEVITSLIACPANTKNMET